MIVVRTPLRISFFGGGTDFPGWFLENKGQVLSTTINKYCYSTCRLLPPFFDHKYRIAYSSLEHTQSIDDIEHPLIRECFRDSGIEGGLELHYDSDLPARSGLGSSSAFAAGLIKSLNLLNKQDISQKKLMEKAIYIERDVLDEAGGYQDQVSTVYGGFNKILFQTSGEIDVHPISVSKDRLELLQQHLMLFFTRQVRVSGEISTEQKKNTKKNETQLQEMYELVNEAESLLLSNEDICNFGKLLHQTWLLKRSLSSKVSNTEIDELYDTVRRLGADGGKILGAGGGGFFLVFAKPDLHPSILKALSQYVYVPVEFDSTGVKVLLQ